MLDTFCRSVAGRTVAFVCFQALASLAQALQLGSAQGSSKEIPGSNRKSLLQSKLGRDEWQYGLEGLTEALVRHSCRHEAISGQEQAYRAMARKTTGKIDGRDRSLPSPGSDSQITPA